MILRIFVLCLFVFVSSSSAQGNTDANPWGVYGPVCQVGKTQLYNPDDSVYVPWFTIDLDKDPTERWREVALHYGPKMKAAISTVNTTLNSFHVGFLWDFLLKLMHPGLEHLQDPYKSELIGLANTTGIPIEELTLLNLFYEISKGCTSIVAEDPNGNIFHARNQDFGTFFIWNTTDHQWGQTDALRDLLVNLNFIQGGKLIFKGITFAGHLGILTGLKPNVFTLSTNARFGSTIKELTSYFNNGSLGRNFLMYIDRDVLMNATSYDEAVDYIKSVPMYAYAYYIVGGNKSGEGAIITRSPNATDHVTTINKTDPNGWYVLQTNYDWDKKDIYLDDRTIPGKDCMNSLTQANVGLAGLYQVLSSKPNLNKATVYTAVMQVNNATIQSFIRKCEDPCWFV